MESPLEDLSASKLRTLLIDEVKLFVNLLDAGNSTELQEKRNHLIAIFYHLTEKEKIESAPLVWGKNSTLLPVIPPIPTDLSAE